MEQFLADLKIPLDCCCVCQRLVYSDKTKKVSSTLHPTVQISGQLRAETSVFLKDSLVITTQYDRTTSKLSPAEALSFTVDPLNLLCSQRFLQFDGVGVQVFQSHDPTRCIHSVNNTWSDSAASVECVSSILGNGFQGVCQLWQIR